MTLPSPASLHLRPWAAGLSNGTEAPSRSQLLRASCVSTEALPPPPPRPSSPLDPETVPEFLPSRGLLTVSPPALPTQTASWLRSPCDLLADKAPLGPDSPGSRAGSSGASSPPSAADRPASPAGSCRRSVRGGPGSVHRGSPPAPPHAVLALLVILPGKTGRDSHQQPERGRADYRQSGLAGLTEQQGPSFPSPATNCPMAPLVLAEKTSFHLGKNPEFSVPDLAPVKGRPGSVIPP